MGCHVIELIRKWFAANAPPLIAHNSANVATTFA